LTLFIGEITGEPGANMQWAHYFRNIVERYQVIIVGWPDNIPFVNLSQASSALPELQKLFDMWETGITHWKTLTDEEFAKLHEERNAKLKSGEISETTRRTRSDRGKKRERPTTTINDGNATRRKKYKSMETIEDSDKENDDADIGEDNGSSAPPHQPSNATPDIGGSSELEPFDCDAALDMLDRLFGPSNSAGSSSDGIDNSMLDFTNFNMFNSTL
jgi:hypothetical protein